MKKILIFLFVLFCIAFGLWYFDNVEAQKLDIYGEVYFTDTDPDSPTFGQEMAVFATQGLTVDPARKIIDSNTEKIAENKYKIYSGVPQFINQGNYWSEVEYQYLPKVEYDSIYKNVEIISFIQTALAQSFSSTVDGKVMGLDNNYTTAHDQINADDVAQSTTHDTLVGQFLTGGTYYLYRSRLYFNTSSLNDSETVSSASLTVYADGNGTADGTWTAGIYEGTTTDETQLLLANYNTANIGTTIYGSKVMSSWVMADRSANTFSLNSDGLNAIDKTGNTTFAFRSSRDVSSSAPTGGEYVQVYYSEETGTTYDPVLIVEMTAGETGGATISYASSSFSEIDVATTLIRDSLWFFITGFFGSIWYFRNRNKRIF